MTATALRLDQWLVAHGYANTRHRARWLIDSGQIWLHGHPCRKPGLKVRDPCQVEIRGSGLPYVSRGGLKLERALQAFGLDVAGLVALDIGASTGGFTDCLLQRGAQRVYAVDAGSGQLAARLHNDPRVIVLERRNIRALPAAELPETVSLITVDVSFISLALVLPLLPTFLLPGGHVVALVKPQFEVGAQHIARGGIVRDRRHREQALQRVMDVAEATGFQVLQAVDAPALRVRGNQEVFIDLGWGVERTLIAKGRDRPLPCALLPYRSKPPQASL